MASGGSDRDTILQANTDARRLLKQALALDEQGQSGQSVPLYQECCRVLLVGLSVDALKVARDENDAQHLASLQQKMSQLFDNSSTRLQSMECVVPTPQYCVDAADTSGQPSLVHHTQADLVLVITSGVRMLSTRPNGSVHEHEGPTVLKIFLFPSSGEGATTGAPAFLQCANWVYPLVPGCSPIFKASERSYTFPDVDERPNPFGVTSSGTVQGLSFVTIVLSSTVEASVLQHFSQTLSTLANVQDHSGVSAMAASQAVAAPPPAYSTSAEAPGTVSANLSTVVPYGGDDSAGQTAVAITDPSAMQVSEDLPSWATKISSGIAVGASVASSVLSVTAQIADRAVQAGGEEIRRRMNQTETVEMNEATKTAVKGAKMASKAAVVVSDQVVSTVSRLTKILADQLVPVAMEKIQTSGDGTPRDPQTQARINGAVYVGSAGVQGVVQVYKSLEEAARRAGRSIQKATVETVKHRYGEEAGVVADESLATVGNVVVASHNIDNVGIRAVAKRTAVQAGRKGLEELEAKPAQQQ